MLSTSRRTSLTTLQLPNKAACVVNSWTAETPDLPFQIDIGQVAATCLNATDNRSVLFDLSAMGTGLIQ